MDLKIRSLFLVLTLLILVAGCAENRYYTQKGAAIGAAFGAGSGYLIGRNTESTLLGTALGGLVGAVLGDYHDQRARYDGPYVAPRYQRGYRMPAACYSPPPSPSYTGGQWIRVPGQYVGPSYVPTHRVWVPGSAQGGIVVER